MAYPGGSDGKTSAYNVGDLGLIPGSGKSPVEATYSSTLAWRIPLSQTRLGDFSFLSFRMIKSEKQTH